MTAAKNAMLSLWMRGLLAVIAVGVYVAKLEAMSCWFPCGDCYIKLSSCDYCTTNYGCDNYGVNCQQTCWECKSGGSGCGGGS